MQIKNLNLTNSNIVYILCALFVVFIDVIFKINYADIGDRINYLYQLKNFQDYIVTEQGFFGLLNFEIVWAFLLGILYFLFHDFGENIPFRIIIFCSVFIFLKAFKKRTNSNNLPILILFSPAVISFYIVKIRHGLGTALFAKLTTLKKLSHKVILGFIISSIHNSFISIIPLYFLGEFIKKKVVNIYSRLIVIFSTFIVGIIIGRSFESIMILLNVRQAEYLIEVLENVPPGGGLYKMFLLITLGLLVICPCKNRDSFSIQFFSATILGMTITSVNAGRLLDTCVPFLISELIIVDTIKNKYLKTSIVFLFSTVFLYGGYLNLNGGLFP